MTRNYGMTARETVGGNQSRGPHYAHDTQRDPLPLPSGSLSRPSLELSEISEPSFDEREAGACFLFCGFLGAVGLLFVLGYCAFVSFVPQPAQYQVRSYANR